MPVSSETGQDGRPADTMAATVRRCWALDLDAATLYELLRLRVDVFVVEQACAYGELDGRDLEPRARHYWLAGHGSPEPVLGTIRLLKEPGGGYRIGRLCTARDVRGRGLGRRLVEAALAEVGSGECVLDAQDHLADFYRGYGFEPVGPAYDWDGVAHVPMHRAART
ncbi:GNAT family N-acetyltransferase [Pseudonocardia sulfidoxydans]|uniref:GNAT family N-acetyltransferase n=1 Tax=Pseudonocardia sulfidoxydans TaxID=54011 RepID=UPI0036206BE5